VAQLLRFGTAVVIHVGPAIATGGFTVVTTLKASVVTALKIIKHGTLASVAGTTVTGRTFTHKSDGHYSLSLLSGDVNTYGHLKVYCRASGTVKALSMWEKYMVVPTNVYDSLVSGGSKLNVGTLASAAVVWTAAGRGLTSKVGYALTSAQHDAIGLRTWAQTVRTLSSAGVVWTASPRTLTSGGAAAASVWAAAARTLTSAGVVWTAGARILSSGGVVWTAAARGLTSKVGYALTSGQHDTIGTRAWAVTAWSTGENRAIAPERR